MCDMTDSYVRHDSSIYATWCIHVCDISHSYVWHDSCICVTWRIHICDMTYSYVRHDAFMGVTWLNHIWDLYTHSCHMYINSCVWHYWFICVTWLIHTCDFAACVMSHVHSFISHEYTCVLHVYTFMSHVYTFIYMKWPIHMLSSLYEPVTPHSYALKSIWTSHARYTYLYSYIEWLIHILRYCTLIWMSHVTLVLLEVVLDVSCYIVYTFIFVEVTHSYALNTIRMSHVTRRYIHISNHSVTSWDTVPSYEWVMSHIWMSYVTRMNESCHTYEWVMSHIHTYM